MVNPISRAIVPAILCRCRVFSHNRSQQIMSSNKISTCTKLGKRASYHSKYDVCLASLRSNTFPLSFLLQIFGSLFFLIRNEWKQNMRCSFSSVHKSIIMKLINPFGLLCLSFHSNWVILAGFFQWMVTSIIILLSYRLATDLRHRKWWPPWSPYIDRSCIREFRSAITSTFTSSFFIHKRLSVGVEHFSFSGFHECSRGILKIKWSEAEYFPTSAACEPIHGEMVGRKL